MRVMDPLKEFAGQEGILLTDGQLDQFSLYMSLLLEWNQKMNLTAITQPEQIIVRPFSRQPPFVPLFSPKGKQQSHRYRNRGGFSGDSAENMAAFSFPDTVGQLK